MHARSARAMPARECMKRNVRAVIRRCVLVLLGLMLGFNLFLANAGAVAGNPMPMPFGVGLAVVQSGSMEPTFYKGDLLVVLQNNDYSEGDIVVFQQERSLTVHRIVKVGGHQVVTQGDANNTVDDPIEKSQIKGSVVACIPKVGYLAEAIRSPLGIFVMLLLAIALVEASFAQEKKARHVRDLMVRRQLQDEIEQLKKELNS